jgi:hypothetical protein
MGRNAFVYTLMSLLVIAFVFLFVRITSLGNASSEANDRLEIMINDIDRSVEILSHKLDSLKTLMPGLGEYMTTIQLHVTKLWFAARANNWGLATYELNELEKTAETVERLHIFKDSVNVSSVIQSVRQSQMGLLGLAIKNRNPRSFNSAYDETLAACNGCHRAAGYGFIHIVTPKGEPVTNQQWKVTAQ